jgi:glycosyltransferase involved in cell wall biosynthesis
MVTTTFPRWAGDGQGPFIWGLAAGVRDLGVDVRVLTMHNPGSATHEVMDGIEVWRPRYWWPESGEALRREGGGLPIMWQKYPLVRAQIAPFTAIHTWNTARRGRDCDLIHAHWSLSAGTAVLARPIHRRPIIATLQGSDIFRATEGRVGASLTRDLLLRCQRITCLSRALADRLIALGVPAGRIAIIPNGVDTDQFAPPSHGAREPLMVFVGSLIERKGVAHLLSALPTVFSSFPELRMAIIGQGPEEAALRKQAEALDISQRVLFAGPQSQDAVRNWLQRAQLLILPSLEEGLGVVLLEALACGTPVVASDVGGIPDVITAEVGRLTPAGNPDALASAIEEALRGEDAWRSMSEHARMRAVNVFDWSRIAKEYVDLYREVTA